MRRSLALFAVSALLPIVMLGAVVGTFGFHSQRNAVERRAQDHARFLATLVGRELVANMHAAQMIAQSPAFDGPIDEKHFSLLANRLVADEPLWRIISVASTDGMRLADAPIPISGVPHGPVVEIESLKRAVATHRPTIGQSLAGKSGHVAFAVRAPVIRDGRVTYVVSTIVDPQAMSRLLLSANLPPGWSAEVVDQAHHIVARTGSAALVGQSVTAGTLQALVGSPGVIYRDRSVDGVDLRAVWRPIPNTRWTVHVAMPAAAYTAPILRASAVLISGVVASIILAVIFVVLLARELRQQKLREVAATESQRLEALGRMTGGVAHDFNNLLTPVIGGLDMLQRRLKDDPKSLRLVDAALVSAERARTLVSRLLSFARRQALRPRDVDIAGLLHDLRDLIERSIGRDIKLEYDLPEAVLAARVDAAQLELAILNLAVNAHDAMPDGGHLLVSAGQGEVTGNHPPGLSPGEYVWIAVTDTGVGMDAETQVQAIEPFFTTKDVGKGTGLGLSMVHGLAAQSGGRLYLSSIEGEGTRVEIWLPAGEAPTAAETISEATVDDRTWRLLLVDDHDLVRRATAGLLREHGHIVTETPSAAEALKLLADPGGFDAIITDYVMPGQSGADLAREARAMLPDIPILLITGFAGTDDDLPPDVPRMAKPFRGIELLAQVSAMLDRK